MASCRILARYKVLPPALEAITNLKKETDGFLNKTA